MKKLIISIFLISCVVNNEVYCLSATVIDLLTPDKKQGEFCGYESCHRTVEGKLNIHIVPHTHGELGQFRTFHQHYTGFDDVYDKTSHNMKKIFDYVLTELWRYEDRTFTFSDIAYLFKWWNNRETTIHRMMYQLIRQGRVFFVGGGWSMSDEATTSYHAIIEHFTYSLRKLNQTFLSCGRPLVSWQADSFGHSKEFASLMAQMGFDGHFVNPISYDDEVIRMSNQQLEFIWSGSDDLGGDSDIFTHKLFDGYWAPPGFCFGGNCRDPLIIEDAMFRNVDERVKDFIESMKHRQAPNYQTRNIMVVMGQRFGYFDARRWFDNIDKLIHFVNTHAYHHGENMTLFYSTPACYLKAVYMANPELTTKTDDFMPVAYDKNTYFSGMFTSRPTLKRIIREGHIILQIVKQLQVLGNISKDKKLFDELHWIMGVLQDHNIITGALRPYVKEYYVEKLCYILKKAQPFINNGLNTLRKSSRRINYNRCQFNISYCPHTNYDSYYIVIYNPLAWPVTIPVRLPAAKAKYLVTMPGMNYTENFVINNPDFISKLQPNDRHKTDHELVFIAENLPPLGYRSYYIQKIVRKKRSVYKKITRKPKHLMHTFRKNQEANDINLMDDFDENDDALNLNFNFNDKLFNETENFDPIFYKNNLTKGDDDDDDDELLEFYSKTLDESKTKKGFDAVTENLSNINDSTTGKVGDDKLIEKEVPFEEVVFIEQTTTIITPTRIHKIDIFAPDVETTTKLEIKERAKDIEDIQDITVKEDVLKEEEVVKDETTTAKTTTTQTTTKPTTVKVVERIKANKTGTEKRQLDKDLQFFSKDKFIQNKYITLNLDANRYIKSVNLSNGVKMNLHIDVMYYVSDDPEKLGREEQKKPGAYVFRPIDLLPVSARSNYKAHVIKTKLVEELRVNYGSFASFCAKIYKDSPIIEIDWVIGPIPLDDKPISLGKDVFMRYTTSLDNQGVFFTDSNGRQMVRRVYGEKPSYEATNPDAIANNFYPITSKVHIEDRSKNLRFSIFNDRAQGVTSRDGAIDIMVHRRILTDDGGFQAFLNDTENGAGITVRGQHYLYLTKANYVPNLIFEKKFAKNIELKPEIFVANEFPNQFIWQKYVNEFKGLKTKLPVGIHLLTIQEWEFGGLLLRLENYVEKCDVSKHGIRTVFLKNLFVKFDIIRVEEVTLSANIWMKDHNPLIWNTVNRTSKFGSNYEKIDLDKGIKLRPQEIRTFVVWTQ